MDLSTWTKERACSKYMGAPPDYSRSGESRDINNDWRSPNEDPDVIGCPGAWYRTPFIQSLYDYRRRTDRQGNRIPNPRLDSANELVQAAIDRLEAYEDENQNEHLVQISLKRSGGNGSS